MDIANNLPLSMDIAFFLTASGEWKKCYWRVQMLMDIAKKIMVVSIEHPYFSDHKQKHLSKLSRLLQQTYEETFITIVQKN